MKKLTKKDLDELAATMNVIPADEQRGYIGQYSNDCFWRCIAYIREGNGSEAIAEIYAQSYYKFIYGEAGAAQTLERYGSGMTQSAMWDYQNRCISDGSFMGKEIGYFQNSNISSFSGSGSDGHVVIIVNRNSDGSFDYYDPQNNECGHITSGESGYVKSVFC